MITLIEGVIGAGKTYYAVNEVAKRYCTWNESLLAYELNADIDLYTNIDGLKVGKDLDLLIESVGDLRSVFNIEYLRQLTHDKRHVFVIDECQEYFHRKFYDMEVFRVFRWSRHLGLDIILITQDVFSLSREIQNLSEYFIRAVRRSYSLGKRFSYHFMVGKEIFRKRSLPQDLKIFNLYRSHLSDSEKPVKYATKYYILFALAVVATLVGGYYWQMGLRGKYKPAKINNVSIPSPIQSKELSVRIVGQNEKYVYIKLPDGTIDKKLK